MVSIHSKYAIADECIILTLTIIIYGHNQWVIILNNFCELLVPHSFKQELDLTKMYLLFHTSQHIDILHVILLIGGEEHDWYVHIVLLFCDTYGYTHITVHLRIHLHIELKHVPITYLSFNAFWMYITLKTKFFKVLLGILLLSVWVLRIPLVLRNSSVHLIVFLVVLWLPLILELLLVGLLEWLTNSWNRLSLLLLLSTFLFLSSLLDFLLNQNWASTSR